MAIQLEPVIAKEHFEYQITCIDSHTQGKRCGWRSMEFLICQAKI